MTTRYRITPTASPTELANQINRILHGIASQFDEVIAGQAKATVAAKPSSELQPIAPPAVGGGTGVPGSSGTSSLSGDVTGDFDANIVGGIQTIPILQPTVDGTVATFVLGVPDIEWKTPVSAAIHDSQTTLVGTTAGTVVWAQIFQFVSYKVFIANFIGYENTTGVAQTIVFPTANTVTPAFVLNITPACTVSATTLTLPSGMGAPTSGFVIVEGY